MDTVSEYHDVACDFQLAFEPAVRVAGDRYAGIVADELGFEEDNIEVTEVWHYRGDERIDDGVGQRGATEICGTYEPPE